MARGACFYLVSSAPYFVGAIGLVNSLRLHGHDEPIFALDCGLSRVQAEALGAEATVVPAPPGREPYTLKAVLPLERPADVMVLLDTDMIVTRRLDPLLAEAAAGRIVAFRNNSDRFVPEWAELLGLDALRRRPYVCSGLVAAARSPGEEVLGAIEEGQGRIDYDRSYFGHHDASYPLLYADQDILNAALAGLCDDEQVVALDARLAPMIPFEGVELIDVATLRCAYADGTEPYLLHHSLSPKPWQHPAYEGVYARLLRRLLTGDDVAIRLPEEEIPRWLRAGALPAAERLAVKARQQLRWRLGGSP
ncbi:MAG TPA: hypothetical protein VFY99_03260 [Solirubrobacterales bacterium]